MEPTTQTTGGTTTGDQTTGGSMFTQAQDDNDTTVAVDIKASGIFHGPDDIADPITIPSTSILLLQ